MTGTSPAPSATSPRGQHYAPPPEGRIGVDDIERHKHLKNELVATLRLFLAITNCSQSRGYSVCQMRASGASEPWFRISLHQEAVGEAPEGEAAPTWYGLCRILFGLALIPNAIQGPESPFQFSFTLETSRSKTPRRCNSKGEEQEWVGNFQRAPPM